MKDLSKFLSTTAREFLNESSKNFKKEPSCVIAEDGWSFVRLPDGTYTDGDQIYNDWLTLKKVGEKEDLNFRLATKNEENEIRQRDTIIEITDDVLNKIFKDKLDVWNYINDETLKRMGYDRPMDMSDDDLKIHTYLVRKGMENFNANTLKSLNDANDLINSKIK